MTRLDSTQVDGGKITKGSGPVDKPGDVASHNATRLIVYRLTGEIDRKWGGANGG